MLNKITAVTVLSCVVSALAFVKPVSAKITVELEGIQELEVFTLMLEIIEQGGLNIKLFLLFIKILYYVIKIPSK